MLGVEAVSVSVTVHWVVAPYRKELGLQLTETVTLSGVAGAWPYGTSKATHNRTITVRRISL